MPSGFAVPRTDDDFGLSALGCVIDEAWMWSHIHEDAAGTQDACHFTKRACEIGEIGVRERRHDGIEGGRPEWKMGRVGLHQTALSSCSDPKLIARQVHADHPAA